MIVVRFVCPVSFYAFVCSLSLSLLPSLSLSLPLSRSASANLRHEESKPLGLARLDLIYISGVIVLLEPL